MTTAIPFVSPIDPVYGRAERLSPLVRHVVAENPSRFTYRGTATFIVGRDGGDEVAVIDPGPALDAHRDALEAALAGERVGAILVTHCHADHSPLATWLAEVTGAPTYAFGPHGAHDPDDDVVSEEALDLAFVPDVALADGAVLEGPGWTIEAVHTPGHTSNHLCYALVEESTLFTGDHVMGWSTTVVAPPDGDMRAYTASLEKLLGRHDGLYRPTHGGPIIDPAPFVGAYLAHRHEREAQILACVHGGVSSIPDIVTRLYADVHEDLHKAAGRSVLAHLVALVAEGTVVCDGPPGITARFAPA